MRIRAKEIRRTRKRLEERIRADIKAKKAAAPPKVAKAPVRPMRPTTSAAVTAPAAKPAAAPVKPPVKK